MNVCTTCKEDFGSVSAFDAHRVGKYGKGEYPGSLIDWIPSQGRRCLRTDELAESGFMRNQLGRWSLAKDLAGRDRQRVRIGGVSGS